MISIIDIQSLIKLGESETLEFKSSFNIEHFKKANLPQPEFKNISEEFMVTVFSENFADKVPDNITENQKLILDLVLQNSRISMSEMSEKIGISKRKVLDNIN